MPTGGQSRVTSGNLCVCTYGQLLQFTFLEDDEILGLPGQSMHFDSTIIGTLFALFLIVSPVDFRRSTY